MSTVFRVGNMNLAGNVININIWIYTFGSSISITIRTKTNSTAADYTESCYTEDETMISKHLPIQI